LRFNISKLPNEGERYYGSFIKATIGGLFHIPRPVKECILLAKISTPVLIVQGGDDKSASPAKATEMVSSLQAKGKTNIDYYFYPGYDHSLNLSDKNPSSEKVIEDIKNWLIKKAL
jgi:alpha-beta hydrolase superfamily lysophospholipase